MVQQGIRLGLEAGGPECGLGNKGEVAGSGYTGVVPGEKMAPSGCGS